jgi:CRP/FNR family transcriptional regulator, cyclic AMP receptor protein
VGGRCAGPGRARVVRNGRTIARVGSGETVGEMSLIDGKPRSATVVAETPIEALVLYRTAFRKLLEHVPSLCQKLLLAQTARIRELDKRAGACG